MLDCCRLYNGRAFLFTNPPPEQDLENKKKNAETRQEEEEEKKSSPERQRDGSSAAPNPVHHSGVGEVRRDLPPDGEQLVAREWPTPTSPYSVVGVDLFHDSNAILVVYNLVDGKPTA